MDTAIFIGWAPAFFGSRIICPPAFFPASAVGDEIGNYTIASAGTIKNKDTSDTAGNVNTATESICPKGWSLPTTKQTKTNRDTSNFNPVLGGNYRNGDLNNETTRGFWWSSEVADITTNRYYLYYNGSSLDTSNSRRNSGYYIRCVSEEKTVTDLTYLQDMTGEIANNTLDGTTASLITRWLPRTHHLRPCHLRHWRERMLGWIEWFHRMGSRI